MSIIPISKKHFQSRLVKVELTNSIRDGHWKFQNEHFTGTVYEYKAIDRNIYPPSTWAFQVSVPDKFLKCAYIVVRPITHPQEACWAGIDRLSINFAQASKSHYRGQVYAKLNLVDVTGEKNKRGVNKGKRTKLPDYIRKFTLRLKNTVTSTRGTDGNYQVAVIDRENYERMIRLFFALKIWVMYDGFSLGD